MRFNWGVAVGLMFIVHLSACQPKLDRDQIESLAGYDVLRTPAYETVLYNPEIYQPVGVDVGDVSRWKWSSRFAIDPNHKRAPTPDDDKITDVVFTIEWETAPTVQDDLVILKAKGLIRTFNGKNDFIFLTTPLQRSVSEVVDGVETWIVASELHGEGHDWVFNVIRFHLRADGQAQLSLAVNEHFDIHARNDDETLTTENDEWWVLTKTVESTEVSTK